MSIHKKTLTQLTAGLRAREFSSLELTRLYLDRIEAYDKKGPALNAIIKTLGHDLASRKITANALLPTALDTPAMRNAMPRDQLIPLDRVAEWIAFLLSERGDGVTGQLITLST